MGNIETEWVGALGERYTILFDGDTRWTVMRSDERSSRKCLLVYAEESECIWWGEAKTFFLDCSEVLGHPDLLQFYPSSALGQQHRQPCFTWHKSAQAIPYSVGAFAEQAMPYSLDAFAEQAMSYRLDAYAEQYYVGAHGGLEQYCAGTHSGYEQYCAGNHSCFEQYCAGGLEQYAASTHNGLEHYCAGTHNGLEQYSASTHSGLGQIIRHTL